MKTERELLYRCKDCGHEQWVWEVVTDTGVYAGSKSAWCDECQDGLPEPTEKTRGDDER